MTRKILRWVQACLVCRLRKTPRPVNAGTPSSVSVAQHPWEARSIDIVSASSVHRSGFRYILTCLDPFTRWVIAIPLKSKSAKDVSTAMFRHIFAVHGKPSTVRSEKGSEFVNAGLKYLYKH
jgi:hypothetical protein